MLIIKNQYLSAVRFFIISFCLFIGSTLYHMTGTYWGRDLDVGAMLVLSSVESEILLKDEKQGAEKMREVASRRKGGWDISLITATIKLLKKNKSLYNCLSPFIKLNLCNTCQNVS